MFRFLLISVLIGCTYHTGKINYKELAIFSSDNPGNKKFEDIGSVSGSKYTWVWESCDKIAKDAVKDMLDEAKSMGGNTVYKIRFEKGDFLSEKPTCKRQWGWLFFLIPFPASAHVEGMAARVHRPAKSSEIRIDKNADIEELAQSFLKTIR